MILVIDNYDSFTYNLVQRMGEIDATIDVRVVRNDELSIEQLVASQPDRVIISPGPCTPNEAGRQRGCGPCLCWSRSRVGSLLRTPIDWPSNGWKYHPRASVNAR
jgi:hypothetical protein